MSDTFDAIVIGSGFGGAVVACRLAERGMRVLVLERGRRWAPADYPRRPDAAWVFDARKPARRNGWMDVRFFPRMIVAQGAGVGGGSLCYSNVGIEANPSVFAGGWPAEITHGELKPYYERVAAMMNLQALPEAQVTQRVKLAREAAEALGHGARYAKAPLAVSFSPDWSYGLDDPFDVRHSRPFVNAQGIRQGTCVHLGNCDVGCDVRAKNTLDVNYLPRAEQQGAEIRPLHVVRAIESAGNEYRVVFDAIRGGALVRGMAAARRVLVAAGSLGSTELLLRCRDEHRTLPSISRWLGRGWTPNANLLSLASYADPERVQQTRGPSIGGVLDFMDGGHGEHRFVVEDDGFPNVLLNALRASLSDGVRSTAGRAIVTQIEEHVRQGDRSRNLMLWLGAGMDAADGELSLARLSLKGKPRALKLQWHPRRSEVLIEAIQSMHSRLSEATGGRLLPNPAWTLFKSLLTIQPLGGCRMGGSAESGVVDHLGRVFGYPNLYVVDGAIFCGPIGRNPSHTIAALAERTAAHAD